MKPHSSSLLGLPGFVWRLILAVAVAAVFMLTRARAADCGCQSAPPKPLPVVFQQPADSWIFMRSRYSHDPETGARVAQYAMKPPVEPLDDPRLVTSGYSRSRVVLRGADGSVDTVYRVQSFGNGRGGVDAEWERFHDAWRGSTISGGEYQTLAPGFGYGFGFGGFPGAYGGAFWPGYGYGPGGWPGNGGGAGYGPGFGQPDAGRLDPDGADGYQEQRRRTPDRRFFNPGLPPRERQPGDEP